MTSRTSVAAEAPPSPAPATRESLFQLTDDLLALDQLLTEHVESGEELPPPELVAFLDEYRGKLEAKVDGVGFYWKSLETSAKGLRAQAVPFQDMADEFARKARVEENKLVRFKTYLLACLAHLEAKELKGQVYKLSQQKNGGQRPLQVNPALEKMPELLPGDFQRTTVSVNTDAMRDAISLAEEDVLTGPNPFGVEGTIEIARLLEPGSHVRLR